MPRKTTKKTPKKEVEIEEAPEKNENKEETKSEAKSEPNIVCSVCNVDKDDGQVVICDTCNKGFHLYCLKPALKKIPKVDFHAKLIERELGTVQIVKVSAIRKFPLMSKKF